MFRNILELKSSRMAQMLASACIGPNDCDWVAFGFLGEGGGSIIGPEDVIGIAGPGP